jgi:hypothetical protein
MLETKLLEFFAVQLSGLHLVPQRSETGLGCEGWQHAALGPVFHSRAERSQRADELGAPRVRLGD